MLNCSLLREGKIQQVSCCPLKKSLSPNVDPLSQRELQRPRGTKGNSDCYLRKMYAENTVFMAAEERHTKNRQEILIARVQTVEN